MEALPDYGRDPLRTNHHARPDGAALHQLREDRTFWGQNRQQEQFLLRVGEWGRGEVKALTTVLSQGLDFSGAPGRSRTPGQELRRLLLCPSELRAHA